MAEFQKIESIHEHIGYTQDEIVFSITKEEKEELKNAIEVLEKYKKLANDAFIAEKKFSFRDSNWHRLNYETKDRRAIITVEQGFDYHY